MAVLHLISVLLLSGAVLGGISNLKQHQLLKSDKVQGFLRSARYKRDSQSYAKEHQSVFQDLKFTIYDREFHIDLIETRGVLDDGFTVEIIGSDGKAVPVKTTNHDFYRGVVRGEPQSEVFLHRDTDNSDVFHAKISLMHETYYIEPAHRFHISSDEDDMLVYRASDLKYHVGEKTVTDQIKSERFVDPEANTTAPEEDESTLHQNTSRHKRFTPYLNTCPLTLVADYKFFDLMGRDMTRMRYYLIDLVTRVDAIYRRSVFRTQDGTEIKNFGLSIQKLTIHTSPSTVPNHYNNLNTIDASQDSSTSTLLDAFGLMTYGANYQDTCLAHLFTAYAFQNSVLGLAYIAPNTRNGIGGICSNRYFSSKFGSYLYLNTGWSSAKNKQGETILTQEAEIVLAHELGHNWGGEHDPSNSLCSPGGSSGNYIMHTYSVSGFDPNNQRFSTCSLASIGQALDARSTKCFKEYSGPNAKGNYRRDDGEDCDDGPDGSVCCTSGQKYTQGSDCSVTNDQCCKQSVDSKCTTSAAKDVVCVNVTSDESTSCLTTTSCDGLSSHCIYQYKSSGSKCSSGYGRCLASNIGSTTVVNCQPFLKAIGLIPCICSQEGNRCLECVREQGSCVPFDYNKYQQNKNQLIPSDRLVIFDGYSRGDLAGLDDSGKYITSPSNSECYGGTCVNENGAMVCRQINVELVARFWKFLTELDLNAAVEFMKDNIVGTIIIFSLILWVPCVIAVHCIDKKRAKQERLEDQALAASFRRGDERSIFGRPLMH